MDRPLLRVVVSFNPRSCEGAMRDQFTRTFINRFNPRSCEGAMTTAGTAIQLADGFNPRSCEGAMIQVQRVAGLKGVSIRAPVRER